MNPISLTFQDKSIETRFQQASQNTLFLQFEWLLISLIMLGILIFIIELVNANYLFVGIDCIHLSVYLGVYFYIRKNKHIAIKYLKMFNIMVFGIPMIDMTLSFFNVLPVNVQVAFVLMIQLYIPLYNSNYNIVQDLVLIVISMCFNIFHISLLIGFTPYYFMLLCGMFQFSFQRYQQIKKERILFLQSLANQSLVDVITKVCKENIIIFTYNLEQHRYEKEIINETAQLYFNTDVLGDILKEIYIKNQPVQLETNISGFIFQNYIQSQKRGEFNLKGYYKRNTNKILISLYVKQYQNIQIILKIEKKQDQILKIRKSKKLINFQLCFLQNLLFKFATCFRMQEQADIQHFKFYNYLHKAIIYNKLQILSMVTNVQFIIQNINLEQMIAEVFRAWNLKHFYKSNLTNIPGTNRQEEEIQQCNNNICSSKMFLELLLHVIAITLRKIILNYEEFTLIELDYSQDLVQFNFHFIPKNFPQTIGFFKENLRKLICKVGLSESLSFKQNEISFKILKQLNVLI